MWAAFVWIGLGCWLLTGHIAFDYKSGWLGLSDSMCGIALILLSIFFLKSREKWILWAVCLIGIWLEFAPLAFWAPTSAGYLGDTLVGILTIAFAILIPGTPLVDLDRPSENPEGWSYNPSGWFQRLPIVFFGMVGWFISRYLAAYQLGYTQEVWDPFFGQGTLHVVTSTVSKAFPVSDAGLGAFAYTLETLMACKGDASRWKTMPWMVISFGILVVPLGLVSILLIILQPLVVGFWCGLCLITATAMMCMIALTVDEVVAVLQFLNRCCKQGKPFWRIFWQGEKATCKTSIGEKQSDSSIKGAFKKNVQMMTQGANIPWNLFLLILIGAYLMCAPAIQKFEGGLADSDHVIGALTIAISTIAAGEVVRSARFVNILFGFWILLSLPWLNFSQSIEILAVHLSLGIALIALSLPKGRI
ncbi:MAG: vitamin K epoxide reductase family protein, partial [Anaerolineae bacterium]